MSRKNVIAIISIVLVIIVSLSLIFILPSNHQKVSKGELMYDGINYFIEDGTPYTIVDGEKSIFAIPSEQNRVTDQAVIDELEANASINKIVPMSTSTTDLSRGAHYYGVINMHGGVQNPLSPMFTLRCDGTINHLRFKPTNIKGNNTISYIFYYKMLITPGYDNREKQTIWYNIFVQSSEVLKLTTSSQAEKGFYNFVGSETKSESFNYEVW